MTTSNNKNNAVEKNTLSEWIAKKTEITIYLKNGISLNGRIIDDTGESLSLSNGVTISRVLKQTITTISPSVSKYKNKE